MLPRAMNMPTRGRLVLCRAPELSGGRVKACHPCAEVISRLILCDRLSCRVIVAAGGPPNYNRPYWFQITVSIYARDHSRLIPTEPHYASLTSTCLVARPHRSGGRTGCLANRPARSQLHGVC